MFGLDSVRSTSCWGFWFPMLDDNFVPPNFTHLNGLRYAQAVPKEELKMYCAQTSSFMFQRDLLIVMIFLFDKDLSFLR